MARSNYVYVVIPQGCMSPIAGFTVKHELHDWLDTQAVKHLVYRVRDGSRLRQDERTVTNITKEAYER